MHHINIILTIVALAIVVLALINKKIEGAPLSEPLMALGIGILAGPEVLDLFTIEGMEQKVKLMEQVARFTLVFSLMSTGLRLPGNYFLKHKNTLTPLILLGMLLMSLFSGLLIYWIFEIDFLLAMLLGAIISPTDPVVATTVVSGPIAEKYLPSRIRHTISAESGANDGAGFPYVLLPLLLIEKPDTAWIEWFLKVVLWENLAAIVLALGTGYVAGRLLIAAKKTGRITSKAFLTYATGLGILVVAAWELMHMNGIIAVFSAAIGLNMTIDKKDDIKEEKTEEMLERLFTIPIFILIGIVMPWQEIGEWGLWLSVAVAVLILLFRRLPGIFLISHMLKTLKKKRDYLFVGWFGPIGVAALYYATIAHGRLHHNILWSLPLLIIFSSTLLHGLTSGPLVKMFSKQERRNRRID